MFFLDTKQLWLINEILFISLGEGNWFIKLKNVILLQLAKSRKNLFSVSSWGDFDFINCRLILLQRPRRPELFNNLTLLWVGAPHHRIDVKRHDGGTGQNEILIRKKLLNSQYIVWPSTSFFSYEESMSSSSSFPWINQRRRRDGAPANNLYYPFEYIPLIIALLVLKAAFCGVERKS